MTATATIGDNTMNPNYTLAAFIAAGMHRNVAQLDEARDAAGTGCLELVQSAMEYVDYLAQLEAAGYAVAGDFPGVFTYEVAEEFGVWYVNMTLADGGIPLVADACAHLLHLTSLFFGRASGIDKKQLSKALAAIQLPPQPVL